MTRILSKLAAVGCGLVLVAGCAPERPDAEPSTAGTARMAVLSSGTGGGAEIVVMDANTGRELDRIETGLGSWTSGLAYHPDGFFLVGQGENVYAIDDSGDSWTFNDEPMWGGTYGVAVSDDGSVTVGNAEDGVTKLDEDGEIIMHSTMGGTCFMDAAEIPGERGSSASIDIYGPRIVVADSESGTLETVASGIGWDTGHLAADNSGRFYAGSYWEDDSLWLADDGEVTSLGSLTSMGIDGADYIKAMTTASSSSVYVLFDGLNGSAIAEVNANGTANEVFAADGEVWSAVTVY